MQGAISSKDSAVPVIQANLATKNQEPDPGDPQGRARTAVDQRRSREKHRPGARHRGQVAKIGDTADFARQQQDFRADESGLTWASLDGPLVLLYF
jgi:hypothetical protein